MTKHDFELAPPDKDSIFWVRGSCKACGHLSHVYTVPALFLGTEQEVVDAIAVREQQWGDTYTDKGNCTGGKK
jgi:hypothetical protein